jgi:hypothetical protein
MASLGNAIQGYQWGSQAGSAAGPEGSLYGGVVGGIDGYFGGPIFKAVQAAHTAPTFPGLADLQLNSAGTGISQFINQEVPLTSQLDTALSTVNNADNTSWQNLLTNVDPSAVKNAGISGAAIQSELEGQVPADVQSELARSDATQSMNNGFMGSPMARNLSARDLGLDSLSMIQKGQAAMPGEAAYDKFLNPSDLTAASEMTSPNDLLQRDDRLQSYNNTIDNQNTLIQYEIALANKTGNLGSLAGGFGLLGGPAKTAAPASSSSGGMFGGGGMSLSSITGMFGSGSNINDPGVSGTAGLGG